MRVVMLTAMLPLMLQAGETETTHCQNGDAVRVIEVVYPNGTDVPCEVHYRKHGTDSVLWRASTEVGYCEQKAADFAEKQRGWGWQCVAMAAAKPSSTDDSPAGQE